MYAKAHLFMGTPRLKGVTLMGVMARGNIDHCDAKQTVSWQDECNEPSTYDQTTHQTNAGAGNFKATAQLPVGYHWQRVLGEHIEKVKM